MERKKQKSTSRAMYVPIAVLIVLFLTIFGTSVFLRVTQIEVIGASFHTDEEIISLSGIMPGDNILLIDRFGAQRRIESSLDYISDARVRRVLPDTVRIEVTERAAVAAIRYRGGYLIINSEGRVLQQEAADSRGLIEIRGFEPVSPETGSILEAATGAAARLRAMIDLLGVFESDGIKEYVSRLDVSNVNNITFRYTFENDWLFNVELGPASDVLQNFRLLPGRIDVVIERHPYGAAGTINMPAQNWIPN